MRLTLGFNKMRIVGYLAWCRARAKRWENVSHPPIAPIV